MNDLRKGGVKLPPDQQVIQDKCFHPSGTFVEFLAEDVEQSITERFEKIVRRYPDRLAVKTERHNFDYRTLNQTANSIAKAILEHQERSLRSIAVLLENDALIISAILGVLKAGKIYVP